jgi:hypothetical protein
MCKPLAARQGRARAPVAILIILALSVLAWALVGAIAFGIWAIF